MKRMILPVLVAAFSIQAQEPPGAVAPAPKNYTWIVTACADWPCASAALVAAEGNKDVIAVPTSGDEYPWLILQRVVAGSVWVPPDAPYRAECFEQAGDALPHFQALSAHAPVMLTVPDGRTVIAARSVARQRAVRR